MTSFVGFLQSKMRRRERARNVTSGRFRRLGQKLNTAMPVVLDATGAMLLSGSAMLVHVVAGVAALGLSVFYINNRIYGSRE